MRVFIAVFILLFIACAIPVLADDDEDGDESSCNLPGVSCVEKFELIEQSVGLPFNLGYNYTAAEIENTLNLPVHSVFFDKKTNKLYILGFDKDKNTYIVILSRYYQVRLKV